MFTEVFTENSVRSDRILYMPSSFAKSSLLYLQETGTLSAIKPRCSKRTHLCSILFFIVLKGEGKVEYEGKTYNLKQGDCVFIDCNNAYSHSTYNNLWQLQWIHFYGKSMPEIYQKYLQRGGQNVFHPENISKYEGLLSEIFSVACSDDYLRDMKINEILSSLLTTIMETSRYPESKAEIRRGITRAYTLQDIKSYLDENWTKKVMLDEIADMFYINKFYLTRLFKNKYGVSILNYILGIRITHAKQQLRFTQKSVEAIALDCGFDDANYFSRAFKKIEGVSPIEYRRAWVK